MKKPIGVLLFILLLLGCENEAKLTFGTFELSNTACDVCPKIEIKLPEALDDISTSKTINTALREEVIALLSFEEETEIVSIEGAVESFSTSFKDLKEKFSDEVAWEAEINGDIVYEDDNMLTLVINAYIFTGGAHGYSSTSFLNFDKLKGTELENWQLFEDEEGFIHFAEAKFRIQEKIPQDGNINATGFMFDGDMFHLAENIGYTPDGIQLIYNQYEVASYADGPIVLTIPYAESNKYLKRGIQL
ncbi:DUF3298 and DUF4163 domain-containing protein [Flagellimonas meridianipacifica]|uniref:Uncharacterized protein DUF3298 n=1 Tax=Flagellimonas meridianipacifica TaxID=1080225 RepID=A0A2T0MGJ4_9FLAO|nr:DUF3298 and DUF4163 domain-containing protein [Allomuricauda pacifica]PRX56698.1 uncharacterized protein DUF3298 [Allomuricauda pacifica]